MKLVKHLIIYSIVVLFTGLFIFCSEKKNELIYINSESELEKVQQKINELAEGLQIDSVSIRSSEGKSIMSSIYIIATNEQSDDDFKTSIEFIPRTNFISNKQSEIKKDALHSSKLNLKDLFRYIESAKKLIPNGYEYKHVKIIEYSANPFGSKYYFELEVQPLTDDISIIENNEYIDWYSTGNNNTEIQLENMESARLSSTKIYVVSFVVENNDLKIIKVR